MKNLVKFSVPFIKSEYLGRSSTNRLKTLSNSSLESISSKVFSGCSINSLANLKKLVTSSSSSSALFLSFLAFTISSSFLLNLSLISFLINSSCSLI
ncbi:MAG: hypothetical protein WCO35_03165 [Candidatus Nomurabacteria bacterium]